MSHPEFVERFKSNEILKGTFLKTPAYELIEVLALAGLDFVAIDAEHAPFDRQRLDMCLAMAKALKLPALVRVPDGTQPEILKTLDAGAAGIIIPHVDSPEKAKNVAKWARYGHGGRGFAGSTRWADYTTRKMPELLEDSHKNTIVIAQIEEPEGVENIDGIASVDGIDGLFVGPADLAVCLGESSLDAAPVRDAMKTVCETSSKYNKRSMTFVPSTATIPELQELGMSMFFIGSEQSWILQQAHKIMTV